MLNKRFMAATAASVTAAIHRLVPEYSGSLFWTFVGLYFVLIGLLYTYTIVIWPLFISPIRNYPHPKGGSLLMGQFWDIFQSPSGEPQKRWMAEVPNDGLIYYRTTFNMGRVMPTTPKAIGEVLVTKSYEFIKPEAVRQGLGRILGIGVLIAEGDEHKRQRKALMPAFHFRHIKDLYPVFWGKSREMVFAMKESIQSPDHEVSITDWVSRATLDIIGVAGMGFDFHAIRDPEGELYSTYRTIFAVRGVRRIMNLLSFILPMWFLRALPFRVNSEMADGIRTIKRTARMLIRSKMKQMEETEKGTNTDIDIISVALKSGGFSEDELVNQLMTFLAAGHETTASAMSWAAYALCRNIDVQNKLREEIRANLPSISDPNARPVTNTDIDNLPYLSAVCNELLRLYPPVGLTLRQASKDTTLAGHFIPKDTNVVIPIWAINTHKELWGDDAGEFIPERWLRPGAASSGGAPSNYAQTTFLHGPRSCIGQAFAKGEFECLLAALVGKFEMRATDLGEPLEIQGGVTQKPKGGVPVVLTEVEGW